MKNNGILINLLIINIIIRESISNFVRYDDR